MIEMKRYRRIEIKAFRHRVALVYGESSAPTNHKIEMDVLIRNADSSSVVAPDSEEGKLILTAAIELLRGYLDITPE